MLPKKIKLNKTLLRTMATLKANGTSWEVIAEKVGQSAAELQDIAWKHETVWYKYLKKAEKSLFH